MGYVSVESQGSIVVHTYRAVGGQFMLLLLATTVEPQYNDHFGTRVSSV